MMNPAEFYMRNALSVARQGQGRTAPNPSVGCVITDQAGKIIARARTADSGRPHAEVIALTMAGDKARGSIVFVTLEPCAHVGKTGACARALIEAGVKQVYVGATDPDPRVSGKGIEMLRNAGIEVVVDVLSDVCRAHHQPFFYRFTHRRPWVTLKIASTLDGKIATKSGEAKWITSDLARQRGHLLRSYHDAIAVGVGTLSLIHI